MRCEEFKMERTGLLEVGDVLPVTEGKLPSSYYYTLGKAYAMSANYAVSERIRSREGKDVYYHDDRIECDFIMRENGHIVSACQVTRSMKDEKTRQRGEIKQ